MRIVISENQSDRMVEIIRRIVSTIDFEGGVKDISVTIPNENFPFPMYDIYLNIDEDFVRENEQHIQQYLRKVKAGVRDKVKQLTGLDVYVGSRMK
jgi:hypothetical protein